MKDSSSNQTFSLWEKGPSRSSPSSKREERRLKIPSEECPRPRRSTFQVKTFSYNKKEMSKDSGRREQAHKHALDSKRSNFWVNTFFFNEEETLKVLVEENKRPNCALNPENWTSKSKIETFKSKTNPWRRTLKQRILHLFFNNRY